MTCFRDSVLDQDAGNLAAEAAKGNGKLGVADWTLCGERPRDLLAISFLAGA